MLAVGVAGYFAILSIAGGSPSSAGAGRQHPAPKGKKIVIYQQMRTHNRSSIPFHIPLSRRPISRRDTTMGQIIQLKLLHERI